MELKLISKLPLTLRRGFVHILVGLAIGVAALFLPRVLFLSLLGVATFLFLLFEFTRFMSPIVNQWFNSFFKLVLRGSETSHLTGASYLLLASLISFLIFARDVAVVSVCFLAVGDALATVIDEYNGGKRLWNKTLASDLSCLLACLVVGFILYYAGLNVSVPTVVVGSIVAAIAEALPLPVDDNLTIPFFAGLAMTLMQFVI
jgi:dolichol kinase